MICLMVSVAEVHWAPDESLALALSDPVPAVATRSMVGESPLRGTLCWMKVPTCWSIRKSAGKSILLRLGREGESEWMPVPIVPVKWGSDGKGGGGFMYCLLPFSRRIPKLNIKGPLLSVVADAVCDLREGFREFPLKVLESPTLVRVLCP